MCFGGSNNSGGGIQETADQQEQMKINQELWDFYQTNYKPMIDKYIARETDPAIQDLEEKKVAGRINASVMKSITPDSASLNPVKNTKRLMDLAELETTAQLTGAANLDKKQVGDIQNIINIGRGEATTASEGIDALASRSLRESMADKELSLQQGAVTDNAIGSLAGMSLAGYMRGKKV